MKKNILLSAFFIMSILMVSPHLSSAQYTTDSWQGNSSFFRAIEKLDSDPVAELFIPVLFGVSLDTIAPNFGEPRGDGSRSHTGLDMMSITGTPIVSPTDAVVRNTGYGASAGNYVYTMNPGGEVFAYLHLDTIADNLKTGDVLKTGDFIGTVGYSGNAIASAPHLHFEIQVDGASIDPYTRIKKTFTIDEKTAFFQEIINDLSSGDQERMDTLVKTSFAAEINHDQKTSTPDPIVVSPEISTAENSTEAIDCSITYTKLIRLGSRGEDVKQVQRCMNSLGFSTGVVDGIYGPNTYQGITSYQRNNGLKYIDGIVGPETSGALNLLGQQSR